jgi:hypothetical protein
VGEHRTRRASPRVVVSSCSDYVGGLRAETHEGSTCGRSANRVWQLPSSWSRDDHEDGGPTIRMPAADARRTLELQLRVYVAQAAGSFMGRVKLIARSPVAGYATVQTPLLGCDLTHRILVIRSRRDSRRTSRSVGSAHGHHDPQAQPGHAIHRRTRFRQPPQTAPDGLATNCAPPECGRSYRSV